MAFTYDLTTDIGEVRLLIGDTTQGSGVKPDHANFTDEEVQHFLDAEGGAVKGAAGLACEVLAAMYATVVDISVGPRRESLSKIADNFLRLAEKYREEAGGGRGIASVGVIPLDGFSQDVPTDAVEAAPGDEYRAARLNIRNLY